MNAGFPGGRSETAQSDGQPGRVETSRSVTDALATLRNVYEQSKPDIDQRTAAWWWGGRDAEIPWWLCMCGQAANDPIGPTLYLAHVAEDLTNAREIKNWAYDTAIDVATERHRGRLAVESYQPSWGHQAARDGVALALWPHLAEYVRGYASQARRFGCRDRAYLAIREGVLSRTRDVLSDFRYDMDCLRKGLITRDFSERHQRNCARRGSECATFCRALA